MGAAHFFCRDGTRKSSPTKRRVRKSPVDTFLPRWRVSHNQNSFGTDIDRFRICPNPEKCWYGRISHQSSIRTNAPSISKSLLLFAIFYTCRNFHPAVKSLVPAKDPVPIVLEMIDITYHEINNVEATIPYVEADSHLGFNQKLKYTATAAAAAQII